MTIRTFLIEESTELASASISEEMHETASGLEEVSIIPMEDLAGQEIIMANG